MPYKVKCFTGNYHKKTSKPWRKISENKQEISCGRNILERNDITYGPKPAPCRRQRDLLGETGRKEGDARTGMTSTGFGEGVARQGAAGAVDGAGLKFATGLRFLPAK